MDTSGCEFTRPWMGTRVGHTSKKNLHSTMLTGHNIPKIDPNRPADWRYDSDTTFQTLTRVDQLTVVIALTQHSKHLKIDQLTAVMTFT